jgi:biotin transport system substrate-specific component
MDNGTAGTRQGGGVQFAAMAAPSSTTLVTAFASLHPSVEAARGIRIASLLFITVLTAASAQISIPLPFTAVPLTLQPMVVLLGALALGSRLGAASQVVYLAAGILGLPVFAASAVLPPGLLRLLGPTGGYLMAYPVAAFLTGYLAERGFDRRYVTSVLAMLLGLLAIYAAGVTWLGLFARSADGAAIGLSAAFFTGIYPFIVPDLIKLSIAAGLVPALWRLLGRAQ